MDKQAHGASESRKIENLPWTCGRQRRYLQLQRDEGTLCPGPAGPGRQLLLEAAPQGCPPRCGRRGPCLPDLPAGGESGLLPCWALGAEGSPGAEGSQKPSGKDPGSSPGRGAGKENSSHWSKETRVAARMKAPTDLGQRGGLSGLSSPPPCPLVFPTQ